MDIKILKKYANEDLALLIDSEVLVITDTNYGTLNLEIENGIFKIYNAIGELLLSTIKKSLCRDFIMNSYKLD